MGKKSRMKMTGLSDDKRIKRSLKRKVEEERKRKEDTARAAKAVLDALRGRALRR